MATYQELIAQKAALDKQQADLEKQIAETLKAERSGVINQIKAMMADHGITVADLSNRLGRPPRPRTPQAPRRPRPLAKWPRSIAILRLAKPGQAAASSPSGLQRRWNRAASWKTSPFDRRLPAPRAGLRSPDKATSGGLVVLHQQRARLRQPTPCLRQPG